MCIRDSYQSAGGEILLIDGFPVEEGAEYRHSGSTKLRGYLQKVAIDDLCTENGTHAGLYHFWVETCLLYTSPADITMALGGVEKGLARHMLAATATPIRKG